MEKQQQKQIKTKIKRIFTRVSLRKKKNIKLQQQPQNLKYNPTTTATIITKTTIVKYRSLHARMYTHISILRMHTHTHLYVHYSVTLLQCLGFCYFILLFYSHTPLGERQTNEFL